MFDFPRVFRVEQRFPRRALAEPEKALRRELVRLNLAARIAPGQTVAIATGSRGIVGLAGLVKEIVVHLRGIGAKPFVVPAMGSHGGATAAGQLKLLGRLGLSEETCACEIRTGMATEVVHEVDDTPIHLDRLAGTAEHVVLLGRVKEHTLLSGQYQSGLVKMLLVGLGNEVGARILHRVMRERDYDMFVRRCLPDVLIASKVAAGIALIDAPGGGVARVEALRPADILQREPELLEYARECTPRLPFDSADVLVIDEIGKDISGTGMDVNVVGRKALEVRPGPGEPAMHTICVRGLSARSQGNAMGIGRAELCLDRVLAQTDVEMTYKNALAAGRYVAGKMPIHLPTDRDMLEAALSMRGHEAGPGGRLMWIENTLRLEQVECSEAYLPLARERDDLDVLTPLRALPLDDDGMLLSLRARDG